MKGDLKVDGIVMTQVVALSKNVGMFKHRYLYFVSLDLLTINNETIQKNKFIKKHKK